MTCDEEFGLFLIANPTYVAYGAEPNNPENDNRYFSCSNFEERRYYVPIVIPDCDLAFAEFLEANPQFMVGSTPAIDASNAVVTRFDCPVSGLARWYGYTIQGNYDRLVQYLRDDTTYDGLTIEGMAFAESERMGGETIDEFYARLGQSEYPLGRFFAADGSYRAFVRKGSRYHLEFPEYILVI